MLIGTVTNSEKVFEIEKPIGSILAVATMDQTHYDTFKAITHTPSDIMTDMDDDGTAAVLSAEYIRNNGNSERLFSSVPLLDIAEYSQILEGCWRSVTNGSTVDLYMMIPLSLSGAIPFMSDETLRFTVDNDQALFSEIKFYSIELPLQAQDRLSFGTLSVGSVKEKTFDVRQSDKIMIPIRQITATTEFHLKYSNGQSVKYKLPELLGLSGTGNDAVMNLNGRVIAGFGRYVIIDAASLYELEVVRNATTDLDLISIHSEVLDTAKVAESVNERLVDVSADYASKRVSV